MLLSRSRFILTVAEDTDGSNTEDVDLRCTVCGRATQTDAMTLTEALEWADRHRCASLKVA